MSTRTSLILVLGAFLCGLVIGLNLLEQSEPKTIVKHKPLITTSYPKLDFLYRATLHKYDDLHTTEHWAHEFSTGEKFGDRYKHSLFQEAGENLYEAPNCRLDIAVEMWLGSQAHKEVLQEDYSHGVVLIAPKKDAPGCYIVYNGANPVTTDFNKQ